MPAVAALIAVYISVASARLQSASARFQGRLRSARQAEEAGWTWRSCGAEGDILSDPGARTRFGWGTAWAESSGPLRQTGALCAASSFGGVDPAPGIAKVCECGAPAGDAEATREELGVSWRRCASEGNPCECGAGHEVRFGAGGRWVAEAVGGGSVACTSASFAGADPAPGAVKECWCGKQDEPTKSVPVAIVTLSRRPSDLRSWLSYHLDYARVDHIFLHIEDTPGFDKLWESVPLTQRQKVTLWRDEPPMATPAVSLSAGVEKRPADDYETLQARQLKVMRRARQQADEMKLDWLLHIDDDELLYSPTHRPVGELLARLSDEVSQAFVPNVEAVYQTADVRSCFTEVAKANMNPYTFVSYANGKAAVRVDTDVEPAGPHEWRGADGLMLPAVHLDQEPFGAPLLVLHFESCPVERWEEKFWELGNTSPEKIRKIPFGFYRESISTMERCGRWRPGAVEQQAASLPPPPPDCTQDALRHLWATYKTTSNPKYRPQDLMPIQIPWDKILSTSR